MSSPSTADPESNPSQEQVEPWQQEIWQLVPAVGERCAEPDALQDVHIVI